MFCINPIVPFDAREAARKGHPYHEKLVEGGLPAVLSQTFRSLIHSRMQVGMASYRTQYRGADVLLFEPRRDDPEMFFTNVFSYSSRHRVFEHAYRATLRDLAARRRELAPRLRRHGIAIRAAALRSAAHARERLPLTRLGNTLDRLERLIGAQ